MADDHALAAGASRHQEETVPIDTNVGLLYYEAELVEFADNAGAPLAQISSGGTPGAGEFKLAPDRRTVTFGDAISSAVVSYVAKMEQAAFDESDAETFALADAETLLVSVDGGAEQTATFNTGDFADIGNATAAEVLAVLNTDITGQTSEERGTKVVMRSDTTGYASSIEVTGGTAAAALGFSGTEQTGSGVKTTSV
jgi:hypothetical protein